MLPQSTVGDSGVGDSGVGDSSGIPVTDGTSSNMLYLDQNTVSKYLF